MITRESFHASHSARFAQGDPATCWFCGREQAKCRRKLWYPNQRDAERAAGDKGNSEAYECPWCDGFHVATLQAARALGLEET